MDFYDKIVMERNLPKSEQIKLAKEQGFATLEEYLEVLDMAIRCHRPPTVEEAQRSLNNALKDPEDYWYYCNRICENAYDSIPEMMEDLKKNLEKAKEREARTIAQKKLLHHACSQQELEELMAYFEMPNVDKLRKFIKKMDEATHPKPATAQELKKKLDDILKNPDGAFCSYDRIYENCYESPEDLIQSFRKAIADAEEREAREAARHI